MEQLREVIDGLAERHVTSWVDAGTLLGLARHGSILPWDRDIDVGCWVEDRTAVVEIAQQLGRDRGYRLQLDNYRSEPFKVEMRPSPFSRDVKIDVSFWWRQGDNAYSPMVCNMPLRIPRGSARWWAAQLVRQPLIRVIWPPLKRQRPLRARPLRIDVGVYLWEVPTAYFLDLATLETNSCEFPVPRDWEGYLEYRYGDWRIPREHWLAAIDDGSARHVVPEEQLPSIFGA